MGDLNFGQRFGICLIVIAGVIFAVEVLGGR